MYVLNELLSSDAYTPVNKFLAKEFSFITSGYFGELVRQRKRFGQPEFFFSQSDMQDEIGLTEHEQRQSLKELVQNGFVTVIKKGLPAKYYFIIHDEQVIDFINHQSSKISSTSDRKNEAHINKNDNKNEDKKIISKDIIQKNQKTDIRSQFALINSENVSALAQNISEKSGLDLEFIETELTKFHDYWTEEDSRGKMRWQKEKTFEIKKRIKRWLDNAIGKYSNLSSKKPSGVGVIQ